MLCPVCKTECGNKAACAKCGFDQVQVDFLSEDEAILWMNNVVAPYRDKWQSRQIATSNDFEQNLLREKSTTSFRDELKQNLRSPEVVRQENVERLNDSVRFDAERTMQEIKNSLMYKAKNAEYVTENGCTYLTCFCQMPHRFMRSRREDNIDQLCQNQKTFVLFRDPNLIYMTWNSYEVEPKHSNEYWQYISALKELAVKENISVESVVYNRRENKYVPFPSRVRNDYSLGWYLCVRARMDISSGSSSTASQTRPTPSPLVSEVKSSNEKTPPARNSQESNGGVIGKSLLAIGLCVGAFALCLSGEMGQLGMAVLLIGAAIGGYFILKK